MATRKKKAVPGLPGGTVHPMMLTQDTARQWCSIYDIKPSTVNYRRVKCYEDDLRNGNWRADCTYDPILFSVADADGNVVMGNGRKRVLAVAETGISMPVFVVYDMPVDFANYNDIVSPLTLSQCLKRAGYRKYTNLVVTLAYLKVRTEYNKYSIKSSILHTGSTHASLTDARLCAIGNMDEFLKIAKQATEMADATANGKGAYGFARFIYLVKRYGTKAEKQKLNQFCRRYADNTANNLATKGAHAVLANRISRLGWREPLNNYWVVGVLYKALRAYIDGLAPVDLDQHADELAELEAAAVKKNNKPVKP